MQTLFLKSIKDAIKHWYIPLLVEIFFVIVSIVVFTSPLSSLITLAILFAVSFLIGGASEIVFSMANRHRMVNWGWSLAFGIITFLIGISLLSNPGLFLTALSFYIGFTILFRSISSISFALDVKRYGSKSWGGLLIFGILGAIFSFILLWNPAFAGLSVVWLVALSFLFGGLFSIFFALQLRKLHKRGKKISPELRERYQKLEQDIKNEWDD
ncbi:HdeD family acid-resistance protein [Mesonia sp. MT50]|uniref:HdeD family acid-resistance protein n=1 Tax=Mesonia profundi TaxID=3070998 RepID=A0ABU1A2P7_9FLAO|nr:HdeD family acid-resistance protein [Mesonia profundi]MDQ7917974.1 HdeD family acid-resistance protein [Mesonia profundi]